MSIAVLEGMAPDTVKRSLGISEQGRRKSKFIDPAILLLFIEISYPPTFVHFARLLWFNENE